MLLCKPSRALENLRPEAKLFSLSLTDLHIGFLIIDKVLELVPEAYEIILILPVHIGKSDPIFILIPFIPPPYLVAHNPLHSHKPPPEFLLTHPCKLTAAHNLPHISQLGHILRAQRIEIPDILESLHHDFELVEAQEALAWHKVGVQAVVQGLEAALELAREFREE